MWRLLAIRIRILRPCGLAGLPRSMPYWCGDEALLVEPEPAIELFVIEQDQPRRTARRDLDIAFELIAQIARDQQQAATNRLAPPRWR